MTEIGSRGMTMWYLLLMSRQGIENAGIMYMLLHLGSLEVLLSYNWPQNN